MNENVRWWDATYCTDGDTEPATMMGSLAAIKSWTATVEAERRVRRSILTTDGWFSERDNFMQWGMDYWWLQLTAHEFAPGEKQPVEAYSGTTNKTYPTWDDLVAAESHGYSVTAVITRGNKTWPYSGGLYPTKAEGNKAKARLMSQWRRTKDDYPGTTYKMFVRPVWKDRRELT